MLPHIERIRIRWLVLTKNLTYTVKRQLLKVFAKTETSLSLMDFGYGEYAVEID